MIILDLRQYPTTTYGAPVGRHVLVTPSYPVREEYEFSCKPDLVMLRDRADTLAALAEVEAEALGADAVMIAGPAYFIRDLELALIGRGLIPVHPYRDANGVISGLVQCFGGDA